MRHKNKWKKNKKHCPDEVLVPENVHQLESNYAFKKQLKTQRIHKAVGLQAQKSTQKQRNSRPKAINEAEQMCEKASHTQFTI